MKRLTTYFGKKAVCNATIDVCVQQTSNPLDDDCCCHCEINNKMIAKLADYEDLEEQGLILILPCKVGSTVYAINSRYTKCTREKQEFDEYSCQGCEWLDCDSHKEYYIHTNKSVSLEWIVRYSKDIGKTVFLTKEEAEQALEEMKGV